MCGPTMLSRIPPPALSPPSAASWCIPPALSLSIQLLWSMACFISAVRRPFWELHVLHVFHTPSTPVIQWTECHFWAPPVKDQGSERGHDGQISAATGSSPLREVTYLCWTHRLFLYCIYFVLLCWLLWEQCNYFRPHVSSVQTGR